ncbi:MAG: hypothetical protein ACLGJB_03830 [Blastocatellia bacterium]
MGIMKKLKHKKEMGQYITAEEKRFIEANEEKTADLLTGIKPVGGDSPL